MRRPLLPLSSVLCLFLVGVVCALWARSYRHMDYFLWNSSTRLHFIGSAYGRIAYKSLHGLTTTTHGLKTQQLTRYSENPYAAPLDKNFAGFAWVKSPPIAISPTGEVVYLRLFSVPDWSLLVILLLIIFGNARRQARRRQGMLPP